MPSTFVGFGFGPIQTGLMLFEAFASGAFDNAVIAEVDQDLVDAVRAAGNKVSINIAGKDGVRAATLRNCLLCNPRVPADRDRLLRAIAEATEMATAVPSVDLYARGAEASIAALIAEGTRDGRPRIIYAAENNNYAAEILAEKVKEHTRGAPPENLQILNTVIGKMSGTVSTEEDRQRLGLVPLVSGMGRCVLVEEFNRILVTRVTLPGFRRRIAVFQEKDDLLPFEEAKLFGHNAIHAVLGYLARLRGYAAMSQIRADAELLALGRAAFVEESGAALIRRHGGLGDALFTAAGFAAYAEDLLQRMTNPYLHDSVERIIRDPARKLAWGDRLFGTMHMALDQGIAPRRIALGAAAALLHLAPDRDVRGFLLGLWGKDASGPSVDACIRLVEEAGQEVPAFSRA